MPCTPSGTVGSSGRNDEVPVPRWRYHLDPYRGGRATEQINSVDSRLSAQNPMSVSKSRAWAITALRCYLGGWEPGSV